jgi:hypothetical protein
MQTKMFKQITREEYLLLADAGVKVSAWEDELHLKEHSGNAKYCDDPKYFPYVVEEIRGGDRFWGAFYAWIDD